MRENLRRTLIIGIAGVLAASCSSVIHRTQASAMTLRLGPGDSLIYRVEIRCSTDVWSQEKPITHRATLVYRITEGSELGYSAKAYLITDTNRLEWECDIATSGKLLDQTLPGDMEEDWSEAFQLGLFPPTIQLPMQPVSSGYVWQGKSFHGSISYKYKGSGFLLGRFGNLISFNSILHHTRNKTRITGVVNGEAVLCPGSGVITGMRSWSSLNKVVSGEESHRWISATAVVQQ